MRTADGSKRRCGVGAVLACRVAVAREAARGLPWLNGWANYESFAGPVESGSVAAYRQARYRNIASLTYIRTLAWTVLRVLLYLYSTLDRDYGVESKPYSKMSSVFNDRS